MSSNPSVILGAGMVTPLGCDPAAILTALDNGAKPTERIACSGDLPLAFREFSVPPELTAEVGKMPRLRRTSSISHFAVRAAMDAVEASGGALAGVAPDRIALLFGSSDGGVEYTRRFFEGIENAGTGKGSPLLFPETVYNAPASHVAAALGLCGESLALVGDSSVGLRLLEEGNSLLDSGEVDFVLAVAAEEADWISSAGYAAWDLTGNSADGGKSGAVFTGGAGALLLSKFGSGPRVRSLGSVSAANILEAKSGFQQLLLSTSLMPDLVVSSDSGNWIGAIENKVLKGCFHGTQNFRPLIQLGDALAASSLWQVILASEMLRGGRCKHALISVLGNSGGCAAAEVFAS